MRSTPAIVLPGARLGEFVAATCTDMRFRDELVSDPAIALRRFRFESKSTPDTLPVPQERVSVRLDYPTLYGIPAWRNESPEDASLRSVQLRLLLVGAKPLMLAHGPERALTALAGFLSARGFHTLLSPQEYVPAFDETLGRYCNRMASVRPAVAGSGQWRALLASEDEQAVALGWLCLLFGWDRFLGALLGYPECCCKAFAERWPVALRDHGGDPALMLLEATAFGVRQLPWETNSFARYFGSEIIQHFPCSLDCAATCRLAHRNLEILARYSQADATSIHQALLAPILLIPGAAVCRFPKANISRTPTGFCLAYQSDTAELIVVKPEFRETIAANQQLTYLGESGCLIGEEIHSGWLLDFSETH